MRLTISLVAVGARPDSCDKGAAACFTHSSRHGGLPYRANRFGVLAVPGSPDSPDARRLVDNGAPLLLSCPGSGEVRSESVHRLSQPAARRAIDVWNGSGWSTMGHEAGEASGRIDLFAAPA